MSPASKKVIYRVQGFLYRHFSAIQGLYLFLFMGFLTMKAATTSDYREQTFFLGELIGFPILFYFTVFSTFITTSISKKFLYSTCLMIAINTFLSYYIGNIKLHATSNYEEINNQ